MPNLLSLIRLDIAEIDADHEQMLKFVALAKAANPKKCHLFVNVKLINDTLQLLKKYCDREEDFMFDLEYNKVDEHLGAHTMMVYSIEEISSSFTGNPQNSPRL